MLLFALCQYKDISFSEVAVQADALTTSFTTTTVTPETLMTRDTQTEDTAGGLHGSVIGTCMVCSHLKIERITTQWSRNGS